MKIAFITCEKLAQLAPEEQLVVEHLKQRGIEVFPWVWSDPGHFERAAEFDQVIFRTPWDYFARWSEFSVFLDRLEREKIPCWNPLPLVRWNLDKTYLLELAAKGVPVVESHKVEGTKGISVFFEQRPEFFPAVIKPLISAAGDHTFLVKNAHEVEKLFIADHKKGEWFLIQPYREEIVKEGEWSFLFFRKKGFSHALLKRPTGHEFRVQPDHGGTWEYAEASEGQLAQVRQVLSHVPYDYLYARVDGLMVDGVFHLMELEMFEPQLFLNDELAKDFSREI